MMLLVTLMTLMPTPFLSRPDVHNSTIILRSEANLNAFHKSLTAYSCWLKKSACLMWWWKVQGPMATASPLW